MEYHRNREQVWNQIPEMISLVSQRDDLLIIWLVLIVGTGLVTWIVRAIIGEYAKRFWFGFVKDEAAKAKKKIGEKAAKLREKEKELEWLTVKGQSLVRELWRLKDEVQRSELTIFRLKEEVKRLGKRPLNCVHCQLDQNSPQSSTLDQVRLCRCKYPQ